MYALGDVNGRGSFTHTAYQDYEITVADLEGPHRSLDGRVFTSAVFIDPPLGRVGLTAVQALQTGRNVLTGTMPMARVTRARLEAETTGLARILVDADTDELLGCTWFGPAGDEVVQVVGALMQAGATATQLREALPVHPTMAEFLPTLLASLEPLGG